MGIYLGCDIADLRAGEDCKEDGLFYVQLFFLETRRDLVYALRECHGRISVGRGGWWVVGGG